MDFKSRLVSAQYTQMRVTNESFTFNPLASFKKEQIEHHYGCKDLTWDLLEALSFSLFSISFFRQGFLCNTIISNAGINLPVICDLFSPG